MRILITGGTGFIGQNIVKGLSNEYRVFFPTHHELDIKNFLSVRKYIKKNKINIIIHTAVEGGDKVLENTLRMFYAINNNLDLLNKFINFGSGAAYGKTRDLKKVKETDLGKFIPEDNYGLAKLICSQLAKDNKKIVTLIPFGIFGPGEDYRFKFISNSIVKNLLGLPIKIKQNVIFDYLYIKDLIPIIKFFLNNNKYYGDYNITTTKSISLKEISQIISKISDKSLKINIMNKKLNYQYTGNNQKLKKTTSILKTTPYKNSIENLYRYYSLCIDNLDKKAIIDDSFISNCKIRK